MWDLPYASAQHRPLMITCSTQKVHKEHQLCCLPLPGLPPPSNHLASISEKCCVSSSLLPLWSSLCSSPPFNREIFQLLPSRCCDLGTGNAANTSDQVTQRFNGADQSTEPPEALKGQMALTTRLNSFEAGGFTNFCG